MNLIIIILSNLFIIILASFCNTCLLDYGLYIIVSSAIIRSVVTFLNITLASVVLIFNGFFLDAFIFSPLFGGSVFIYLLFYVFYYAFFDKNTNKKGLFNILSIQCLNVVFFVYSFILSDKIWGLRNFILSLILSQILVYFLDFFLFSLSKSLLVKNEQNPFNVARDFFKNDEL